MWNLKVFVVLIGTLWISGVAESFKIPDEAETEVLSQALVRIAKEIIAPINQTVNIVTCDGVGNRLNNLPKYLMKDLNNSMTFTNELRPKIKDLYGYGNSHTPALIVICDEWNIAEDEEQIKNGYPPPKLGMITYITKKSAERYINAIQNLNLKIYPKTLVLVNDDDYLDLKVAAYISEKTCTKAHLRTINRFSKRTRQWQKPSFDLVKLRSNNHECALGIFSYSDSPEVIWPGDIFMEGTGLYSELSGYFITMTNELARRLNFQIQNKMGMNVADLTLSGFSTESISFEHKLIITDLISIYREVFVVIPLGDFYSGFEKLFLPFDDATWILIAMTFAIGRDVTAPTMNLFAAFFGLGQLRLPGRNFARFLLMLYIIWCLIIRTAYQGVLYDLLKGDGRRPQNMQLQDYIANNATIHVNIFTDLSITNRMGFERFGFIWV